MVPLEDLTRGHLEDTPQGDGNTVDFPNLRAKALDAENSAGSQPAKSAVRRLYERSKAVRDYVLFRAAGHCEACNSAAPFRTKVGDPYLEPHHIRRLSDGGPDNPRFVAALCPNCHRRVHHGHDGLQLNQRLAGAIEALEVRLDAAPPSELIKELHRARDASGFPAQQA